MNAYTARGQARIQLAMLRPSSERMSSRPVPPWPRLSGSAGTKPTPR